MWTQRELPLSGRETQAHAGYRHRRNDRQRPYEAVRGKPYLSKGVRYEPDIEIFEEPRQEEIDLHLAESQCCIVTH